MVQLGKEDIAGLIKPIGDRIRFTKHLTLYVNKNKIVASHLYNNDCNQSDNAQSRPITLLDELVPSPSTSLEASCCNEVHYVCLIF